MILFNMGKLNLQIQIIDEKGKVIFSNLKYDRNALFQKTPVFPVPPLNFDTEEDHLTRMVEDGDRIRVRKRGCSWGSLKELILNNINQSNQALEYLKEFRENQQFEKYKKPNLPFYYLKKNNLYKLKGFFRKFFEKVKLKKTSGYDYSEIGADFNFANLEADSPA